MNLLVLQVHLGWFWSGEGSSQCDVVSLCVQTLLCENSLWMPLTYPSCISELDYKEEQSSELETLRCIYTDEELTGTQCVARLHTAAIEQLCHVCISLQKYRRTLPASKSIYPARMQMAPQVSPASFPVHTWPHSGLTLSNIYLCGTNLAVVYCSIL